MTKNAQPLKSRLTLPASTSEDTDTECFFILICPSAITQYKWGENR